MSSTTFANYDVAELLYRRIYGDLGLTAWENLKADQRQRFVGNVTAALLEADSRRLISLPVLGDGDQTVQFQS